ncbi:MAG: hypothetical protein LBM19_01040 [Holosporales bacterium]|jgi:hypothetical protein|nr:hypothetical protein [Holosporales bacterium]
MFDTLDDSANCLLDKLEEADGHRLNKKKKKVDFWRRHEDFGIRDDVAIAIIARFWDDGQMRPNSFAFSLLRVLGGEGIRELGFDTMLRRCDSIEEWSLVST